MKITNMLLVAVAGIALSGCATRGYVDDSVAGLDAKHSARITELDDRSRDALERAKAAGLLAEGKFMYSIVLTDDAVKFEPGRSELSADAEANLMTLVNQLKAENKNVYLEIQGHTDSIGTAASNKKLGLARAEAVRFFLHKQGIALNRMATISYGEEAPIADNMYAPGRATNRRVMLVVLK